MKRFNRKENTFDKLFESWPYIGCDNTISGNIVTVANLVRCLIVNSGTILEFEGNSIGIDQILYAKWKFSE